MSELAVSLLRLSYLLALWFFVFAALAVLRRDTYGTKIVRRDAATESPRRGRLRRVGTPSALPPAGPRASSATSRSAADGSPGPPPSRLVVLSGPLKGTSLPLGHGLTVGRSGTSNLVLDDEFTSARHAAIVERDGGWWVEDLGSTNGTFVGRQRVGEPVAVRPGTAIRIGQTKVELR
ncbi:MAG: FHA domain-containing protein [Bifidobacteriaceae bacterium]|jgi:pSer/pThr/pTyr-binding forkhead associated (FHA) protein|nr:FHA domain-containing protein [Bifidobacteriaceae bacterium]